MRVPPKSQKSGPGRPRGRYTQHRRLEALREALENRAAGYTVETLAAELRITERSVRRYLDELKRQTELEDVALRPGGPKVWRIKPGERGRAVTLRRTQAYGLLATRRVFEALRGSALYDELDVVVRELLLIGQRPTRPGVKGEAPSNTRLHERFLFLPPTPRGYGSKGEELDTIFDAVAGSRVLRFRHRPSATDPRTERVTLEPYALVLHGGRLHCLGRDVDANALRVFRLEHMSETKSREDEPFALPDSFDVAQHLEGEFGVGTGAPRTRVIAEFDAQVADDVRARHFHPTQRVGIGPGGRVRLSFQLEDLDAFVAWVLSFGPSARVIEPPELVRAVEDKLVAMLARYRS